MHIKEFGFVNIEALIIMVLPSSRKPYEYTIAELLLCPAVDAADNAIKLPKQFPPQAKSSQLPVLMAKLAVIVCADLTLLTVSGLAVVVTKPPVPVQFTK